MKILTKIQSISDIITNSSSETFLMYEDDAKYYKNLENTQGCVTVEKVTIEWIISNYWESDLICDFLNITGPDSWSSYEDWCVFVELYIEPLLDKFVDIYFVDIEDHFADCEEVLGSARSDALISKYRH